jgi:DNA-binding PucR family transcriptional regulator
MTANSRTRKIKHKRSNHDDDTYSQRYRAASDAAKAARARAAEADRAEAQALEGVRVQGVSLVPTGEGTGYILEVGAEASHELEDCVAEAFDVALFPRDGEDWRRSLEFKHATAHLVQEALRSEAAPDATALGERAAASVPGLAPSDPEDHVVFFEKEVDGIIEYSHQEPCDCSRSRDHWTIL